MARLFVAREAALGRSVVIKVLPPELTGELSAERFRREVQLAAGLQHPHIVPVLTADGDAGVLYYTMPFIEGESLRVRLDREPQLRLTEALQLAREIAEALAYAHARGIVHRDVKPANILLSGGHAMLTDFGIAKATADARRETLMATGLSVGTPQYMAPEQASGERDVDGRADVYAVGCVLYEMLAGRPPFSGPTAQSVVAQHMTAPFPQVRHSRPDVPAAIDEIVRRASAKSPADRYSTAASLAAALAEAPTGITNQGASPPPFSRRKLGRPRVIVTAAAIVIAVVLFGAATARHFGTRSSNGIRSIAVLPFANLSGDTAYDYFADGVSDQLRSDLTSMPGLHVMGAASSARFRSRTVDARDAGSKLGVAGLVEGTVNRSGSRLRVTAELVNAADGVAVSSMTFDTQVTDLATIQDSITRSIAARLRISLASAQADTAGHGGSRGTSDFGAYDLFLRASFASDRHDYPSSLALLDQAVAKDPAFARAYAMRAFLYARRLLTGFGSRDSALALARSSLAKAVALDSKLIEVYHAKAMIETVDFDFIAADATVAEALVRYPGNSEMHETRSATLGHLGRVVESGAESRRAKELDPLSVAALLGLQYHLYVAREYASSFTETQEMFDLNPGTSAIPWYQVAGSAYLFMGETARATDAFEKGEKIDPTFGGSESLLLFGYAAAGRWKEARALRARLEHAPQGNSPNYDRILIHEAFGEMEAAMVDLERTVAAKEPLYLPNSVSCDPLFDPLKANPRFGVLMKRLGVAVCPATGRWPVSAPPK